MVSGADFNHDGKIDLIVAADIPGIDIPTGAYYLVTGNGTTSFSGAKKIFAGHYAWSNIAIGDFDADSNADVAITDASGCSPKHCVVLLHILFGNGAFGFTTVNPSLETSDFNFDSGDVNNDGKTDLFGTGAASHSYVVYGRKDRAMTITEVVVPSFSSFRRPAIADLNGDGRNDVAGTRFRSTTNDYTLLTLLRRADGTFAAVDSVFFGSTPPGNSVATGDFNKDTKPDLLVKTTSTTSSAQTLNELLNTTSGDFGGCSYPAAGQGIHICKPTASATSPVAFNASANSFQPIRKIELWVDGKKVTEQFHVWDKRAWFRSTQSLAAGTHRATFIAANPDNTLLRSSISFAVSGTSCTPSSSTATVICSPANGTTVSNPVNASAKGGSSVKNMEIWVDGTRRAVSSSNSISVTLTLSVGSHKLTAFSKNGSTVLSSAVSNFTVK
jgi:hypothetical protein